MLSARPPHKGGGSRAPIEDRLAMLELATAGEPELTPSDVEVRRPGPSYTYDTLREIGDTDAHPDLYLILGIDAYREIDTWYRAGELLALANVIVTTRPGQSFPSGGPEPPVAAREACCYDPRIGCYLHDSGHVLIGHRIDGINVSASEIRSRVRNGLSIDHLTGADVARYIRDHGLYGDARR